MRALTVAQARQIDRDAVQRLQMPSILLMENAARSVAEVARTMGERYVMLDYLTTHAMAATDSGALPPGRGRETFAAMCSRCHALPDPRVHSPDDWPIVYARMERNMDRMGVPRPAGSEPGEILEYLRVVSAKQ